MGKQVLFHCLRETCFTDSFSEITVKQFDFNSSRGSINNILIIITTGVRT